MGTAEMSRAERRSGVFEAPAYTVAEAAAFLHMMPSTVRSWMRPPVSLVAPADRDAAMLSFNNMVELHVLYTLRWRVGMSMQAIQRAMGFLLVAHGPRPFLTADLYSAKEHKLLVGIHDAMIEPTSSGQVVMRPMLASLKRIERDNHKAPIRLFPLMGRDADAEGPRAVVIDPVIQFGRPCVAGTATPTVEIASRFKAGETRKELADDFGLTLEQVGDALKFHALAA